MSSMTTECSEPMLIAMSVSLSKTRRGLADWANDSDDFLVYSRRQRDADLPIEYDV